MYYEDKKRKVLLTVGRDGRVLFTDIVGEGSSFLSVITTEDNSV